MKNSKIIAIVLVALLCLGWYTNLSNSISTTTDFNKLVTLGDEQFEKELYQKSYNSYIDASKIKMTKKLQEKIVSAYEAYFKEAESYNTYKSLAGVYNDACKNYPSNEDFWRKAISLQIAYDSYEEAMKIYKNATSSGIREKKLADLYKTVLYSFKEKTSLFNGFVNENNGYFIVQKGMKWKYISADLENESDDFAFISRIGKTENNLMLLIKDFDEKYSFIDDDGVINGKIKNLNIIDAKMYKEGKIAVKTEKEKWVFIDIDSKKLFNEFDDAGNFCDNIAPVCLNGKWGLIDEKGKSVLAPSFEDVKLNPAGDYVVNKTVIAKKNGKYGFYNEKLTKSLNSFSCDDMDIVTDDEMIAFCQNGKWGFVSSSGKVLIDPQYDEARSFSNGLAPVCINGKWGYINPKNEKVTSFDMLDAQYVSSSGAALVSREEGFYNFIIFNFADMIAKSR